MVIFNLPQLSCFLWKWVSRWSLPRKHYTIEIARNYDAEFYAESKYGSRLLIWAPDFLKIRRKTIKIGKKWPKSYFLTVFARDGPERNLVTSSNFHTICNFSRSIVWRQRKSGKNCGSGLNLQITSQSLIFEGYFARNLQFFQS